MKKALLLTIIFVLFTVTGCTHSSSVSSTADGDISDESVDTSLSAVREEISYAEQTEQAAEWPEGVPTMEGYSYMGEPNTRIDMFSSNLKANGKEYLCNVFMYRLTNEFAGYVKGMIAAEIYLDGQLTDIKTIIGALGINSGPDFDKDNLGEYLKVFNFEEKDVLAFLTPSPYGGYGSEDTSVGTRVLDSVFYAVDENDRLVQFERRIEDYELEEYEKEGSHHDYSYCLFRIADNCGVEGNCLSFSIDSESFLRWKSETQNEIDDISGENISVRFDFSEYRAACEDERFGEFVFHN